MKLQTRTVDIGNAALFVSLASRHRPLLGYLRSMQQRQS